MSRITFSTSLVALLTVVCPAALVLAAPDPSPTLDVFLQGSSAAELQLIVAAQGGEVTHELPIIDAVGARLTRSQLDAVLKSPKVARHFDDLAPAQQEEDQTPDSKKNCDVAGSLEVDLGDSSLGWTLYNKKASPVLLETLELKWPAALGRIDKIRIGESELDPALYAKAESGIALLDAGSKSGRAMPGLHGTQQLQVDFHSASSKPLRQSDFSIKATFSASCSIELIPGYEDNHENFYYTAVAGVDALHQNGVTGSGVTVAIIDSGLWEHPALKSDTHGKPRVLARYDAIDNVASDAVFDASGHGTHMTSVIAHSGPVTHAGVPTGTFKGVAPDVSLVSVKAFDVAGQGDFLDIVRAIQWVVDNRVKYNIRVLNLSFAARPRWHYWQDPINQAVMRAWASGITVIAAAGNEGPEPMTIGSPGNLPFVITVGAVTDSWTPANKDDDYIPDFSSRGPTPSAHIKPDLVAPGGHITGLTRPGSTLTTDHPEYMLRTGELVMTGSSQAAALVSGVAALLLQLEPDLSPNDIKCKLMSSAEPAINDDGLLAYSPFQQGQGYVNASRAVTLGQKGCGNAGLDILQEMAGAQHSQGPAVVDKDGNASLPGLDTLVSPEAAAMGMSKTRKWGVKAHIERLHPPLQSATPDASRAPFNWMQLYMEERAAIEDLSSSNPR